MPEVTIELTKPSGMSGTRLSLKLNDTPLADVVVAALQQPNLEALQVCWSGNGLYIVLGDGLTIPDMEGAEMVSEFVRGDVLVYPEGNELVLAYGHVEMFEGSVELDCYQVGRVAELDLDDLVAVGNNIHREGARVVRVV